MMEPLIINLSVTMFIWPYILWFVVYIPISLPSAPAMKTLPELILLVVEFLHFIPNTLHFPINGIIGCYFPRNFIFCDWFWFSDLSKIWGGRKKKLKWNEIEAINNTISIVLIQHWYMPRWSIHKIVDLNGRIIYMQ